jgi:hypothetical protein
MSHVAVLKPSLTGKQGLEPKGMWQHQSSPSTGGRVRSWEARDSVGVHLYWEVRSRAEGHVAPCGCVPCCLPYLYACTWGYPIFRVPTVAPRPTLGEIMNLLVGSSLCFRARSSWIFLIGS